MKKEIFVGIDVSKDWLDVCSTHNGSVLEEVQIENSKKAILVYFRRLIKTHKLETGQILCCMEHTGIYNAHALESLNRLGICVWVERALQIKQSLGAVRGKSDKVDALRISDYARRHQDKCIVWKPQRKVILTLKMLLGLRTRLLKTIHQWTVPLGEGKKFMDKNEYRLLEKLSRQCLATAKKSLEKLEKQIAQVINQDPGVRHLYRLVQSIDGVGPVIALNMIVITNEFQDHKDSRRFACYAGVVPFEHSSGTSIRRRSRVSHMANKSIKTLLTLGARSAVNKEGELRNYYLRKVEEGKNERSVINAVRNKLIARIFAVVKRDEPYQKNYCSLVA